MISAFANLRALALLRRIARTLEQQTALAQARLELDYPGWERRLELSAGKPKRRAARMVDFSVPTPAEWNDQWEKDHPERA